MDVADIVGDEIDDLFAGVDDSRLLQGIGLIAEAVDNRRKAKRHMRPGQSHRFPQLFGCGDRHDSGKNRHVDAGFSCPVEEVIEDVIVKKHLGGQKVDAGVHLLLQIIDILPPVGAFDMAFRIAGSPDAEITARADLFNEIAGVQVVFTASSPFRDIAAKGHDIFDSLLLQKIELGMNEGTVGAHTGHMGNYRDALSFHQVGRDFHRHPGRGACRSVGHAHKIGFQRGNCLGGFQHILHSLLFLGRKYLKADRDFVLFQNFADFHTLLSVSFSIARSIRTS